MPDRAKEKVVSQELVAKAKEKAKQLVEKFRRYVDSEIDGETRFVFSRMQQTANAKQCALFVCEEKMLGEDVWEFNYYFYDLVKQQIEKLNDE